jgi:hypothetical protein
VDLDVTEQMKERAMTHRLGKLDRQNEKMRTEISLLHDQLDRERSDREDLRDAVRSRPAVKVRRGGGLLRMIVIGGAAYVLGARAGRERYRQIMDWVRSTADRASKKAEETVVDVRGERSSMTEKQERLPSSALRP